MKKKIISCNELALLYELCEEIRKYQGITGSAKGLFGIADDFVEKIEIDSLSITRQPNFIFVKGKAGTCDFKIHKFGNVLKIEKNYKDFNINIIRFIDSDFNVRTNSTITDYKVNNNPLLKNKTIRGEGNATLLCDHDGNFICEEQFWDMREASDNDVLFKPYVRYEISQAIDEKTVLRKGYKSYCNQKANLNISYSKYGIIRGTKNSKKELCACGEISEATYYELLEKAEALKKSENVKAKQKLKDRIFKHKA